MFKLEQEKLEQEKILGRIVARYWLDLEFRHRFLNEPLATLTRYGLTILTATAVTISILPALAPATLEIQDNIVTV